MTSDNNENWSTCPRCGSPVLLNPETTKPEACSNCAAKQSRGGLYGGSLAIVVGIVAVALVLYFCIRLLVH